uniref:Uncharacterized protein n=1 Tax=Ditylenchus dipsaci TaxID=166011 RepID=A0A915CS77_9BILA
MNAIGQAMGMDQQALMELVQIALNQLPVLPAVVQPAILVQQALEEIEEENDNITFVNRKGKDKAVHKGFPFKQQRKNKYGSAQDWQWYMRFWLRDLLAMKKMDEITTLTTNNIWRVKMLRRSAESTWKPTRGFWPRSNSTKGQI